MRSVSLLVYGFVVCSSWGCQPRSVSEANSAKTGVLAGSARESEVPEFILIRSISTDEIRMWPSMIIHKHAIKFFGTSNDLTMVGGDNKERLLSFAKLPLNETQDFPNYNQGQCFSVEIIYQNRTVRGFLFHLEQSELADWFDRNLPDKARYLLVRGLTAEKGR